jgi:hypothetical protein
VSTARAILSLGPLSFRRSTDASHHLATNE